MEYKSKVLLLVCFFILTYIMVLYSYYIVTEEDYSDGTKQLHVLKRVNIIKQRTIQSLNTVYNNPCEESKKEPSFKHKGRISEEKCSEYVWKRSQLEKCEQFRKKRIFGIIGGYAAMPGDFPHMAAIGWRTLFGGWTFKCGATLISPTFLVTAAHCTKSKPDQLLQNTVPEIVRLGVVNLESSAAATSYHPVDVDITRIIKYPKYKSPTKYYDIALLKLQGEVKFSATIQPACLWSKPSTKELGRKVVTSGWGLTNVDKRSRFLVLRAVNLFVINSGMCEYLLKPYTNRHWSKLVDHQLCAGELAGGLDTCQGDSGGPLQVEMSLHRKMYYLIGVTSFGYGCGLRNVPGVYVRVAGFIDWIEENVWKEEIDQRRFNASRDNRKL